MNNPLQTTHESWATFNKKVLQNLVDARKAKHLSQEQLADLLFMSRQNYGKLETGRSELKLTQIYRLSNILDFDPCSLLFTHDHPKDEYYYQLLTRLDKLTY